MSYIFTASERAQIQAAIDASTGLEFDTSTQRYVQKRLQAPTPCRSTKPSQA